MNPLSRNGAVTRKRPEKCINNNWFLHHDNAPAHWSIVVKNFFANNNETILKHPPYTPNLASAPFYVFPQQWMDGTFVMILTSLRMRRKSFRDFHQMASRNISNTFTVAGKCVQLQEETISKEM